MAEEIRTTISVVFWSETTDEAEGVAAAVREAVPEPWRDATLATVEHRPGAPYPDTEPAGG